jgi:glutathione S-transferase
MLTRSMRLKLYVIHGSPPCAVIEKAMAIKGLSYDVVEWPPPVNAPMQRAIFGARTVPGLTIDGQKVSGSRAIIRRLEQLAPEPPLFPVDTQARERVEEAERWADETFQAVARKLLWVGLKHTPEALVSYGEHSKLRLPAAVVRFSAPLIADLETRLNRTNDEVARSTVKELPVQLDKIDAWIADRTIGDMEHPNAADLQLASIIRLLLTLADARPLIQQRPCAELAMRLFPHMDGELPSGSLPAA